MARTHAIFGNRIQTKTWNPILISICSFLRFVAGVGTHFRSNAQKNKNRAMCSTAAGLHAPDVCVDTLVEANGVRDAQSSFESLSRDILRRS